MFIITRCGSVVHSNDPGYGNKWRIERGKVNIEHAIGSPAKAAPDPASSSGRKQPLALSGECPLLRRKRTLKYGEFRASERPLSGKADIQELTLLESMWNVRFTLKSEHPS